MAAFTFCLPPGLLSRDGGGAYVRSLTDALQVAGHSVQIGSVPAPASIYVIDGAALADVPLCHAAGAVALVHHTTPLVRARERSAVQGAERERLHLVRCIITTSEAMRDRLVGEAGLELAKIAVVQPGVPDVQRSVGSGSGTCCILSVGALVARKGHATLLRALALLPDLDWRLVIVGNTTRDPAHTAALQTQVAQARVADRVRFAGSMDDTALAAEWAGADMFALATEWEGYSAPVAEALRRGLPVAVAQGGAAAALVVPEVGIVVQPGDAEQLSKAMRRMIFDTELRSSMAAAAWRAGQALPDWPTQAARFVEAVAA